MLKALVVAAMSLMLGFSTSAASAATLQAKAILHADKPGAQISRSVYGQFSEHLGGGIYDGIWVGEDSPIPNVRGIRSDVVAALKALKTPLVRWPGGCFADEYHWRDGIGPRAQRPVRKNNWWGDAPETNAFGTHEFMDFVEQIGAEAYVSVNVGSSAPREISSSSNIGKATCSPAFRGRPTADATAVSPKPGSMRNGCTRSRPA